MSVEDSNLLWCVSECVLCVITCMLVQFFPKIDDSDNSTKFQKTCVCTVVFQDKMSPRREDKAKSSTVAMKTSNVVLFFLMAHLCMLWLPEFQEQLEATPATAQQWYLVCCFCNAVFPRELTGQLYTWNPKFRLTHTSVGESNHAIPFR